MGKADTGNRPGDDEGPRAAPAGEGGAGNEFAIHEHIGRHLKMTFDEVADEPIPEKLRALLDKLDRKPEEEPAPLGRDNSSTC